MVKLSKRLITVFGEDSVSSVVKDGDNYYVIMDKYPYTVLAYGKELKGYVGDIIRVMYTGDYPDDPDTDSEYILESDRHGMICKFPDLEPWERYGKH